MGYERKISDEQAKKLNDTLTKQMNVLDAENIVIKVQVGVLKDILIDAGITSEQEFKDRSMDLTYEVLKKTNIL